MALKGMLVMCPNQRCRKPLYSLQRTLLSGDILYAADLKPVLNNPEARDDGALTCPDCGGLAFDVVNGKHQLCVYPGVWMTGQ